MLRGENTQKSILINKEKIYEFRKNDTKIWRFTVGSGHNKKPFDVIKPSKQVYRYNEDSTVLYDFYIYFFETDNSLYIIFHRPNSQGCKTVFLETMNNILKKELLKLEMELIVPLSSSYDNFSPTEITGIQYEKQSSDIADNLKPKSKKKAISVTLNLNSKVNNKEFLIIKELFDKNIDHDKALSNINLNSGITYDEIIVSGKIGKRKRKIKIQDFENMIGAYDITEEVSKYRKTNNFLSELDKITYEYYKKIINSKEVQ